MAPHHAGGLILAQPRALRRRNRSRHGICVFLPRGFRTVLYCHFNHLLQDVLPEHGVDRHRLLHRPTRSPLIPRPPLSRTMCLPSVALLPRLLLHELLPDVLLLLLRRWRLLPRLQRRRLVPLCRRRGRRLPQGSRR